MNGCPRAAVHQSNNEELSLQNLIFDFCRIITNLFRVKFDMGRIDLRSDIMAFQL